MNELRQILVGKPSADTAVKKSQNQSNLSAEEKAIFGNELKNAQAPKEAQMGISKHALRRIEQREIDFDSSEYIKIKDAVAKLRNKGSRDSLLITNKAAYIVDVKNNKLVTAINPSEMNDNIFTKIDSTMFVN